MAQITAQLLDKIGAVAQKVEKLEGELRAAREEGKRLVEELREREAELAGTFGVQAAGRKATRGSRSLEGRIMIAVSRLLNSVLKQGVGNKAAREKALGVAVRIAAKNGSDVVPPGVLTRIEERLKARGR